MPDHQSDNVSSDHGRLERRSALALSALSILAPLALAAPVAPGVSIETLKRLLAAFNRHDLDAVMEFFADDCELQMPRGPDPWGQRYVEKSEVRKALGTRFTGIPDVHYGDDRHFVSGDRGVSEWELTGTGSDGRQIRVRGCDLLQFRGDKIIRKDSYWKNVDR